ncbi:hypothetical protein [Sphingorhabdus contaminans]|uniref:Lipoprotein n=1 Tax=Sphingorhabdus contaminans TaxID=1343899 RepID=A0A553WJP2_9SPHN|nr:hypothetical protein [Sphingorhabdus contaminans]TSB04945.1 hypothetical protein FOM92_06020 [Sphingorhabdus contaminans]
MKFKVVVLSALLTGCGNSAVSKTDYAVLTGRINEQMLAEVSKNIDGIHSIVITSQGGDSSSAMDLARLIYDHHIHIRVEKYCLSACAQYILPSAKTIEFVDKPIVGLHQSPISIRNFYERQNVNIDQLDFDLAKKEEEFFRHINLKTDIATQPLHYLDILCYTKKNGRAAIASKWAFFIPSPDTYKSWIGKGYTGSFAYTKSDVIDSSSRHIPESVSMAVITEDEAIWRPFKTVSKCPAT